MIALGAAALVILLLTWVAYPAVIALRSEARRAPARIRNDSRLASVVIATRDPPEVVARRVDDIREGHYPSGLLQVVVAVDARAPFAPEEYAAVLGKRALVVRGDEPGGKAAALNAAVRWAEAEILIFADSHQTFEPEAIPLLVGALQDGRYAAVSGAVAQASGDAVIDLYWRYELLIRRGQAAIHSIVSTSGQICAMRRALWTPLPAELICDDLYITMQLVMRGYRVGFSELARAVDPRRFTKRQHFQRKVRTLTGLFQFVLWMPAVLLPWKNPIWGHFVCHKLMRFVTPYLTILVVIGASVFLAQTLGSALWIALAVVVVLAAAAALARPTLVRRVGTQFGWALWLQAVPVVATLNGLRGRWQVWQYHTPLETGKAPLKTSLKTPLTTPLKTPLETPLKDG